MPAFGPLGKWSAAQGVQNSDAGTLLHSDAVQRFIIAEVRDALSELARYEMPKKIVLITDPLTIENGLLTPTQKVKRKAVRARYATEIGRLYEEEFEDQDIFVAD